MNENRDNLDILILGCGYTGQRVTKRFLARGARVTATTRNPERLQDLGAELIRTKDFPSCVRSGMLVLHSIPPDGPENLLDPLRGHARRFVYLSSTAVYGRATDVDETTPADPSTERARARLEAERGGRRGTVVVTHSAPSGNLRTRARSSGVPTARGVQSE